MSNSRARQNKWYDFRNSTETEVEIYLYNEIGYWGSGAKEFISELRQHTGKHVHLRINSPGGEVIEGTAILNALKRHAAGVTVHIDALAASMASAIAMAGNPVLIADNALLMIHDPYTFAAGTSEELRKSADLLDTMKANLVRSYEAKTGLPTEEIESMMAEETWLGATEAVALGFADGIEDGVEAAASMTPDKAKARFDTFAKGVMPNPKKTKPRAQDDPPKKEDDKPEDEETEETPTIEELQEQVEELQERVEELEAEAKAAAEKLGEQRAKFNALRKDHAAAFDKQAKYHAAAMAKMNEQYDAQTKILENLERTKGLAPAQATPPVKPEEKTLTRAEFNTLGPVAQAEFFRNGGKLSD